MKPDLFGLISLCQLQSLSLNAVYLPLAETLSHRRKVAEQCFRLHLSWKSPESSQGKSATCQNVTLKGTLHLYAKPASSLECYSRQACIDKWTAKPCRNRDVDWPNRGWMSQHWTFYESWSGRCTQISLIEYYQGCEKIIELGVWRRTCFITSWHIQQLPVEIDWADLTTSLPRGYKHPISVASVRL